MLKYCINFPSQNPGLRLEGRRTLLVARLDRLGQLHGPNLGMASLVHTGPTDTQSIEEPPIHTIAITDKDVETDENLWNLYERWQRHYRPVPLDPNENQRRFKTFKDRARFFHQFRNDPTFTSGLNGFADLTNDEFRSACGCLKRRFDTFRDEARFIHQFRNDPTFTGGLHGFADLTSDEFRSTYGYFNQRRYLEQLDS